MTRLHVLRHLMQGVRTPISLHKTSLCVVHSSADHEVASMTGILNWRPYYLRLRRIRVTIACLVQSDTKRGSPQVSGHWESLYFTAEDAPESRGEWFYISRHRATKRTKKGRGNPRPYLGLGFAPVLSLLSKPLNQLPVIA